MAPGGGSKYDFHWEGFCSHRYELYAIGPVAGSNYSSEKTVKRAFEKGRTCFFKFASCRSLPHFTSILRVRFFKDLLVKLCLSSSPATAPRAAPAATIFSEVYPLHHPTTLELSPTLPSAISSPSDGCLKTARKTCSPLPQHLERSIDEVKGSTSNF